VLRRGERLPPSAGGCPSTSEARKQSDSVPWAALGLFEQIVQSVKHYYIFQSIVVLLLKTSIVPTFFLLPRLKPDFEHR